VTQLVSTLAWQASGDPAAPVATVSVNFGADKQWRVGLIGEYLSKEQRPRGVTIDNTANGQNVSVQIGPSSFTVNQFARQTFAIPNGQADLSVVGTAGSIGLVFFITSLAPTADGSNQFAIAQAAAQTAAQLNSSAMNPIINSQFTVWSEGANLTVAASALYGPEGWQARRSLGGVALAQAGGIINSRYSAQVQRPAADANASLIEFWSQLQSTDCLALQGQTVTLGYDIIFGADFDAASLNVQVVAGVGIDQNIIVGGFSSASIVANDIVAKNLNAARRSVTFTVPVNATQLGLYVAWNNPAAAAGANDWYRVSRFQFDIGTTSQAYRPVPDAMEVSRCKYFFELIGDTLGNQYSIATGMAYAATIAIFDLHYLDKRIQPAITISIANLFLLDSGSVTHAVTSVGAVTPGINLARVDLNVAGGLVAGTAVPIFTSGNPPIKVNARL